MNSAITAHQSELQQLCRRFHVLRLELFGSALKDELPSGKSDFDFLVEFKPLITADYAAAYLGLKDALERLLGRPVDLVVSSAIRNPYFRQSIEQSKALLYAA